MVSNFNDLKTNNIMNADEFLKKMHHLDEVFKSHDDAEYNERQLTQFAERYYEAKLKLLNIPDVVGRSEQLVCYHKHTYKDNRGTKRCAKCKRPME